MSIKGRLIIEKKGKTILDRKDVWTRRGFDVVAASGRIVFVRHTEEGNLWCVVELSRFNKIGFLFVLPKKRSFFRMSITGKKLWDGKFSPWSGTFTAHGLSR